jgi:hypothetical protein
MFDERKNVAARIAFPLRREKEYRRWDLNPHVREDTGF